MYTDRYVCSSRLGLGGCSHIAECVATVGWACRVVRGVCVGLRLPEELDMDDLPELLQVCDGGVMVV